jgi:hypothetical protein
MEKFLTAPEMSSGWPKKAPFCIKLTCEQMQCSEDLRVT